MCSSIISEVPFSIRDVPDQYKTQQIWNKSANDCLAALKFVPDLFLLLCMQMKIYYILMKILVMSHFVVMKWVFLV